MRIDWGWVFVFCFGSGRFIRHVFCSSSNKYAQGERPKCTLIRLHAVSLQSLGIVSPSAVCLVLYLKFLPRNRKSPPMVSCRHHYRHPFHCTVQGWNNANGPVSHLCFQDKAFWAGDASSPLTCRNVCAYKTAGYSCGSDAVTVQLFQFSSH